MLSGGNTLFDVGSWGGVVCCTSLESAIVPNLFLTVSNHILLLLLLMNYTIQLTPNIREDILFPSFILILFQHCVRGLRLTDPSSSVCTG